MSQTPFQRKVCDVIQISDRFKLNNIELVDEFINDHHIDLPNSSRAPRNSLITAITKAKKVSLLVCFDVLS